jgi:hypothetical protein
MGNISDLLMPIITGQLRTLIAAGGAYLGTYGLTVSGEAQDTLLGAGLVVVSLALSGVQKWWAERKKRRAEVSAAKASAEATMAAGAPTPVTVNVTPAGLPNEAVRVSRAEAAAAPAVPAGVVPSPAPPP